MLFDARLVMNALKLLHGMELMLCFFLLCACSAPAPADKIDFVPAATSQSQPQQQEHSEDAVEVKAFGQATVETPAPVPAPVAPAQIEAVPEVSTAPMPVPEEVELVEGPSPAATAEPMVTPALDSAATIPNELFSLQNVAEIGSAIRVQIPRALVKEGFPPTAEYVVHVTYSSKVLLSCLVEVIGADEGAENTLIPVTVDLKTGERCKLSDFFTKKDTGWRGLLPDLVTEQAQKMNLTLLCEVPPVGDDQPFYIEDGKIVLLYRPYEIATYEAGAPTFVLPEEELTPYLSGAYGIGE